MGRILGLGALILVIAVAAVAALPAAETQASAPASTCTRGPDNIYNCDKAISVGKHIAIKVSTKVCHANVISAPAGPGGLAAIRIVENVSACPWVINAVTNISFRVAQAPSAVGGITDVISDAGEPLEQSATDSPASSLLLALAAAGGVSLIAGAIWGRRLLGQRVR